MTDRPRDDDAPVTIATFPHPHEAELARMTLDSRGVPSVVLHDHGQYATIGSWVHVQVAARDRDAARAVLEDEPGWSVEAPSTPEDDPDDDMRRLRIERRLRLGRWFLYASTASLVVTWWATGPAFLIPLALAIWSKRDPRPAFATAFVVQLPVVAGSIVLAGPYGLLSVVPLGAYYWAWTGAAPAPPEWLLAGAGPIRPAVEIGEAWQAGASRREPAERPIWLLRPIGFALLALLLLTITAALLER